MLGEINTALSIWERLIKWFPPKTPEKSPDNVASRFVLLFEKHGIHRNQIPRFFGHDLTLDQVSNDEKLLPCLTPEILLGAAELFAIRLQWLEGADKQIYELNDFYKHPEDYDGFLKRLNTRDDHRSRVELVLSVTPGREDNGLIVVEEDFALLDNEPVTRYHLCGGWIHQYYKCRADLAACIAMTLKQGIFISGVWKQNSIQSFCEGHGFISDLYQAPYATYLKWLFLKQYAKPDWHPDHWIYDPEDYLNGIDEGEFGKTSALELWLDHFNKGYLETGYVRNNAIEKFKAHLLKFQ